MLTPSPPTSVKGVSPTDSRFPVRGTVARVGMAFTVAFGPLLLIHFYNTWRNDHYQHVPLIFVIVGVMFWLRCRGAKPKHACVAPPGGILALIVASLSCLAIGIVLWAPWWAYVGGFFAVGAFMLGMPMRVGIADRVGPWLLLLLALPLPLDLDDELVLALQGVASRAASGALDLFRIEHLLHGHIIETPGRQFMVEEACSGIHSLFVLTAVAAIVGVWERRSVIHIAALVAIAVVWAVVINTARIGSVVVSDVAFGIDISAGWAHELLGLFVFAIAMGMLVSSDRAILFFFARPPPELQLLPYGFKEIPYGFQEDVQAVTKKAADVTEAGIAWPLRSGLVAVILVVAVPLQAVPAYRDLKNVDPSFGSRGNPFADTISEDSLPAQVGNWQRAEFEWVERPAGGIIGDFSATWRYEQDGLQAFVSFDFPFVGWHHLTNCYRGQGWMPDNWSVVRHDQNLSAEDAEVRLRRDPSDHGFLVFSEFKRDGVAMHPPAAEGWTVGHVAHALKRRLLMRVPVDGLLSTTYQFQVLAVGHRQLTESELNVVRDLYIQTRPVMLREMRKIK